MILPTADYTKRYNALNVAAAANQAVFSANEGALKSKSLDTSAESIGLKQKQLNLNKDKQTLQNVTSAINSSIRLATTMANVKIQADEQERVSFANDFATQEKIALAESIRNGNTKYVAASTEPDGTEVAAHVEYGDDYTSFIEQSKEAIADKNWWSDSKKLAETQIDNAVGAADVTAYGIFAEQYNQATNTNYATNLSAAVTADSITNAKRGVSNRADIDTTSGDAVIDARNDFSAEQKEAQKAAYRTKVFTEQASQRVTALAQVKGTTEANAYIDTLGFDANTTLSLKNQAAQTSASVDKQVITSAVKLATTGLQKKSTSQQVLSQYEANTKGMPADRVKLGRDAIIATQSKSATETYSAIMTEGSKADYTEDAWNKVKKIATNDGIFTGSDELKTIQKTFLTKIDNRIATEQIAQAKVETTLNHKMATADYASLKTSANLYAAQFEKGEISSKEYAESISSLINPLKAKYSGTTEQNIVDSAAVFTKQQLDKYADKLPGLWGEKVKDTTGIITNLWLNNSDYNAKTIASIADPDERAQAQTEYNAMQTKISANMFDFVKSVGGDDLTQAEYDEKAQSLMNIYSSDMIDLSTKHIGSLRKAKKELKVLSGTDIVRFNGTKYEWATDDYEERFKETAAYAKKEIEDEGIPLMGAPAFPAIIDGKQTAVPAFIAENGDTFIMQDNGEIAQLTDTQLKPSGATSGKVATDVDRDARILGGQRALNSQKDAVDKAELEKKMDAQIANGSYTPAEISKIKEFFKNLISSEGRSYKEI